MVSKSSDFLVCPLILNSHASRGSQTFRAGVPKLSLAMYPFSIAIDEQVPLKILITKRLRKITKNVY